MSRFFLLFSSVLCAAALAAQPISTQRSKILPCPTNTFFKVYGTPAEKEWSTSIVPVGDGNFYLAGRKGEKMLLTKMTPAGDFLWIRLVNIGMPEAYITEIIVDAEGMIVGAGQKLDNTPINSVVFRYDPVLDKTLWIKTFDSDRPTTGGIIEKSPGGNFVLYQNPRPTTQLTMAEVLELDRTTGNLVPGWQKRYTDTVQQNYNAAIIYKDALYATGYHRVKPGIWGGRMLLTKLDTAGGGVLWSKTGHLGATQDGNLEGNDILVDQDSLVVLYTGQITAGGPSYLFLQKTDLHGQVAWTRRYGSNLRGKEILAVPDGYIIFAERTTNPWVLYKTDKSGNVLTTKTMTYKPASIVTNSSYEQNQIALIDDHLFFVNFGRDDKEEIRLLKTDLNLELEDTCNYYATANLGPALLVPNSANYPAEQMVVASTATQSSYAGFLNPDYITQKSVCACPGGPCGNRPDLKVSFVGLRCSQGQIFGQFNICNVGESKFSGPVTIGLYDDNPFSTPAHFLTGNGYLSAEIEPDSCKLVEIANLNILALPRYHVLIAIQPVFIDNTPFTFDTLPPYNDIVECSYSNNLDSFELVLPVPQKPDLGPDRLVCPGQKTILDAGNGYLHYNWLINNTDTQTLSVTETGEYIVEVVDQCERKIRDTVQVTVLPYPTRSERILLLPGDSITIGGTVYSGAATVIDTVAPVTTAGCDTLVTYTLLTCTDTTITRNIAFYPGDTIVIEGTAYTQSDTVVQVFTSMTGCDSVVTNILQLIVTSIAVQCPTAVTVTLPPNSPSTVVDYNLPTATTDCPDPALDFTLLQGLPVGGSFPEGTTRVCYQIANRCGIRDTCCFNVTALPPELPCDAKSLGCINYELLETHFDSLGQRRYRIGVQNNCITPIQYVYIQLPNGVSAVSPAADATYTAPGGNTYLTRNPNASPFYSLRFKPVTGVLNSAKEDIFEYTLPQQAEPAYIHVGVRLNDGSYSEVVLNTFNCPVQPYATMRPAKNELPDRSLAVWPNPTDGQLFVQLQPWLEQQVQIRILNAQGQLVLDRSYTADRETLGLDLPAGLTNGLYYLSVQPLGGAKTAVRFILER